MSGSFLETAVIEILLGDVIQGVDSGAVSVEDFGAGELFLFTGSIFSGIFFGLEVRGIEDGGVVSFSSKSFPPAHTLSTSIVHV